MDLKLTDVEIKEALVLYVNGQGFSTEGKSVSIELKSGRKGNGHSANIVISPKSDPAGGSSVNTGNSADSIFGGDGENS